MADPRPDPTGVTSGTTGTPAWLKVFGIVLLIAVVVVIVVFVTSGFEHGPRLHGAP